MIHFYGTAIMILLLAILYTTWHTAMNIKNALIAKVEMYNEIQKELGYIHDVIIDVETAVQEKNK